MKIEVDIDKESDHYKNFIDMMLDKLTEKSYSETYDFCGWENTVFVHGYGCGFTEKPVENDENIRKVKNQIREYIFTIKLYEFNLPLIDDIYSVFYVLENYKNQIAKLKIENNSLYISRHPIESEIIIKTDSEYMHDDYFDFMDYIEITHNTIDILMYEFYDSMD